MAATLWSVLNVLNFHSCSLSFRNMWRKSQMAHLTSKHRSDISPSGFSVLRSNPCGKDTLHRHFLRRTTLMVHTANICFMLGFPFLKIHTWVTGDTKMTHIVRLSQQLYWCYCSLTAIKIPLWKKIHQHTSVEVTYLKLFADKKDEWHLRHVLFEKNAHFSQLCRQIFN